MLTTASVKWRKPGNFAFILAHTGIEDVAPSPCWGCNAQAQRNRCFFSGFDLVEATSGQLQQDGWSFSRYVISSWPTESFPDLSFTQMRRQAGMLFMPTLKRKGQIIAMYIPMVTPAQISSRAFSPAFVKWSAILTIM